MSAARPWLTPEQGYAKAAAIGRTSVPELLACLSEGFDDLAKAIHASDQDLGEHASGAVLQAITMLPKELRDELAHACSDQARDELNDWLKELAL